MMRMADEISKRSTCARRAVGCVLTDIFGRVVSTGHNGVPKEEEHCTEVPCPGAEYKTGEHLDLCNAAHAELNALLFCNDIMTIYTCYTTSSPCNHCMTALLQSSCQRLVFSKLYSEFVLRRWTNAGREYDNIVIGIDT